MFDQARFLCQLSYKKKKKKTKTWVFSALGSLQWQVKDWGIIVIMLVSSGGNARMLSTALWWFPGGSGPWTGWATCGATREGSAQLDRPPWPALESAQSGRASTRHWAPLCESE